MNGEIGRVHTRPGYSGLKWLLLSHSVSLGAIDFSLWRSCGESGEWSPRAVKVILGLIATPLLALSLSLPRREAGVTGTTGSDYLELGEGNQPTLCVAVRETFTTPAHPVV